MLGEKGSGRVCLPLPLGEGRGEGLVRQRGIIHRALARFGDEPPVNSSTLLMLAKRLLNGLRAEARSTIVVAVWAQDLTPTLSHRERESNCTTTYKRDFVPSF